MGGGESEELPSKLPKAASYLVSKLRPQVAIGGAGVDANPTPVHASWR